LNLREHLDTTIVNTAVPSITASLNVAPLSLKTIVTSYILSFAVCIPMSGWLADHFGTKRVFSIAVILFTLSSILCGVSINASMLVAARILQGVAAAMMMPVGRLTILRTYSKPELLRVMNFVIIPALIAPLLGPTIGGTIVHWFSWRTIFFVNVPIGLLALFFIHKYMPDYYGDKPRPFDLVGMVLFTSGIALLSWLLEVFGEHQIDMTSAAILLLVALSLLGAYVIHARRTRFPLLSLTLFRIRTFRISVSGGFITRLGVGGLPFLLPFLYQQGLGMPAWQSGLLMMPVALAAIGMKLVSIKLLNRYGYRSILIANTLMNGIIISLFSLVTLTTPLTLIILLSLGIGF
jgi:EmrB/QacA subfamily drug resistance transporter